MCKRGNLLAENNRFPFRVYSQNYAKYPFRVNASCPSCPIDCPITPD